MNDKALTKGRSIELKELMNGQNELYTFNWIIVMCLEAVVLNQYHTRINLAPDESTNDVPEFGTLQDYIRVFISYGVT